VFVFGLKTRLHQLSSRYDSQMSENQSERVNEPIRIYGYHGTSRQAALTILRSGFRPSNNDYDWLGTGVYFFQDAPLRALQWATEQHPQNPAVIRSLIRLENCIDLFDLNWFPLIRNVYNSFVEEYRKINLPLPRQNPSRSKAHRLDCAYFNYISEVLQGQGQEIEAIRAVFIEGERVFPNSAIFDLAHVQIAIRNTALIEDSQLIQF
jgi:hypothetical protein